MTLRDLQDSAKKMSRPWGVAKAFEHSAPCTPIVPVTQTGHPRRRGDLAEDQRRESGRRGI